MSQLKRGIYAWLQHLLTPDKIQRVEALALEVAELEREWLELQQGVPLWDRILFFEDAPDEGRRAELELALKPRRKVLAELRQEVQADLERVGREFPPFGLGVELERCFRLAQEGLRVEERRLGQHVAGQETLLAALQALADRVVEIYVPDLAPTRMFRTLSREAGCKQAARANTRQLETDELLGFATIRHSELLPRVAQRLREGPFFAEQARLHSLERERDELERAHREAAASVSLFDRVKLFSNSAAVNTRNELRRRLGRTEESLKRCYETTRRLLHEALAAYPPLAVHLRLLEAIGVVGMLRVEQVRNLDAEGAPVVEQVVAPLGLVCSALRRLLETFSEVFPDVPLPLEVALELSDGGSGRRRPPREILARAFAEALSESSAPTVRDQALEHAAMQGSLARSLQRVADEVSLVDRIIFWSGSQAEQRRDALEERVAWHRDASRALWGSLLGVASRTGAGLAPLAVRDLAVRASDELDEVHADTGSWSTRRAPRVYNAERVQGTVATMQRTLGGHYGLEGGRGELLVALAAHPPVESPEEPGQFEPLRFEEVLLRLARRLHGTAFADLVQELGPPEERPRLFAELTRVELCKRTGEPELRRALDEELSEVTPRQRDGLRLIAELVERAFDAYPPGRLYYALEEVAASLARIHALSESEVGRRGEKRYRCRLVGKATAHTALVAWRQLLVRTYGRLPNYQELLQQWELRGISNAGWSWELE